MSAALHRLRRMGDDDLYRTGNSYLGLASQASHGHADAARIANILRKRGHCVAGDLSKAYLKGTT